jgi:hypothetical protein
VNKSLFTLHRIIHVCSSHQKAYYKKSPKKHNVGGLCVDAHLLRRDIIIYMCLASIEYCELTACWRCNLVPVRQNTLPDESVSDDDTPKFHKAAAIQCKQTLSIPMALLTTNIADLW